MVDVKDLRLDKLCEILKPELMELGESHGWPHSLDVMNYSIEIGKMEKADLFIGLPAAVVHDIGLKKEYGGTHSNHGIIGSNVCGRYLESALYTNSEIDLIRHCVAAHNVRYEGLEPQTIEAKVLIDADTFDKADNSSIERAYEYMKENGMSEKDFAIRWILSREKLMRENKLWWTETGRIIGDPLVLKTLEYWKGKM